MPDLNLSSRAFFSSRNQFDKRINLFLVEYFFLKPSTDLKIIGQYPQSEKMCGEADGLYNYSNADSVRWLPSEGPLKTLPKVDCVELKYRAKLTDQISTVQIASMAAKIVSEKFFELLQEFRCMPYTVLNSHVLHRGKKHDYRFLYFQEHQNQFVDFSRSRFMLSKPVNSNYDYTHEEIVFDSFSAYHLKYQELENLRKKSNNPQAYFYIQLTELYLNESSIDMDFFRFYRIYNCYIVSKNLKNAIEKKQLTGFEFIPAQSVKIIQFDPDNPRRLM